MNALIIGFGSIARKHLAALHGIHPGATVTALRSSSAHDPVPGVTSIVSLDQLPQRPDFVIISNPTSLHGDSIRKAAELGCPLFVEKPVLSSLSDAPDIQRLVRERNLLTYTACNLRFHPVVRFLKQYLQDQALRVNEVNLYCGSYLPDWRPGKDYRTIYSANEEMGGGVHLDLIHEIDCCTWLFGMPDSSERLMRRCSSLEISAADFASYRLLYPGFTAGITLNYYRRDPKREIEIVTGSGTIHADLLACRVEGNGEVLFQAEPDMAGTYTAQMRYFLEHLESGSQPMNSIDEAIGVLRIALHEQAS
ncbi:MAG: Gfo/Idh/MocA family oxidoreductase [Akkermansiaceae bacterium]|nr:Gfo/Idh/MocA family oxidoreductase [Akkermansiaceae bacterium]